MKNLKETKALIERYESITLKEIKEIWDKHLPTPAHWVAKSLTGFGATPTCTLCIAVGRTDGVTNCQDCIHVDATNNMPCISRLSSKTYNRVDHARNPRRLLTAFRARAKYLKTLL